MSAPAAPTGATLTQAVAGQGYATFAWSHVQTGLDRFEILHQEPGETVWTTWALSSKAVFGAAGSYSTVVPIRDGITWAVRAFNTSSEVSSADTAEFDGITEGCWILPYLAEVFQSSRTGYLNAEASPFEEPRPYAIFDPDSRDRKIVQLGRTKGYEGTISGDITADYSLSADEWRQRLRFLMKDQENYRLGLVTPHLLVRSVTLLELPLDPWVSGSSNYGVSLAYVEVD